MGLRSRYNQLCRTYPEQSPARLKPVAALPKSVRLGPYWNFQPSNSVK